MSLFPHSRLFLGVSRSIVVTGPYIQVLNSQNGELLYSTEKHASAKTGPIRNAAVDESFTHMVTAGDDKKLRVWEVDGLKLLSERELPKKSTGVLFTRDGQTILISDKFGDIFSYPLHPKDTPPSDEASSSSKRTGLLSHENPSDGDLILGHVSLLTCFSLSPDEKYIITADRDEHIRVSWYPQGYVIERYCLGHEKYVSAIHLPPSVPSILVSGGGDPMLKLWDWLSGNALSEIPVQAAVEPFIKVKTPKRRRAWDDGEGGNGDEAAGNNVRRRRKRGRKGRGKDQDKEKEELAEGTPDVEGDAGGDNEGRTPGQDETTTEAPASRQDGVEMLDEESGGDAVLDDDKAVLVIHKIESLDLGEHGRVLVFSAIGASALFYCVFPETSTSQPPQVHAFDLGQPIIDFTLGPDKTSWVLLDPSHGKDSSTVDRSHLAVLLSWASGSPALVDEGEASPLLSALRSACAVPATSEDLRTLELYSALSSMPKNVDSEHDPLKQDPLAKAEGTPEPGTANIPKGKAKRGHKQELTQRELARLKRKNAVAAKLQEHEEKMALSQNQASVSAEDPKEVQRDSKRPRQDADITDPDVSQNENAMDES